MNKHTPGPWRYEAYEYSNCMRIYCRNDPNCDDNLIGYCGEENARLIAAAPDLLKALDDLLYQAQFSKSEGGWDFEQAESALAKAKGEV